MAFANTMEALNAGVAIIYQELHLIPEMTVAENIYLGQLPHRGGIVNRSLLNYEGPPAAGASGSGYRPGDAAEISLHWSMADGGDCQRRWRVTPRLSRSMSRPARSLRQEIDNLFRVIRGVAGGGKGHHLCFTPDGRDFCPQRCHHRL